MGAIKAVHLKDDGMPHGSDHQAQVGFGARWAPSRARTGAGDPRTIDHLRLGGAVPAIIAEVPGACRHLRKVAIGAANHRRAWRPMGVFTSRPRCLVINVNRRPSKASWPPNTVLTLAEIGVEATRWER